ncbi:MAG: DUF5916 domain-containing protein, partial [Longimicrobiales bacterium]|nr:DUF5916 domain-containing protein [Longimicrobiales bacterium]
VSAGAYRDFKRVTDPRADRHRDRITPVATGPAGTEVTGDFDGDGTLDAIASPDFNLKQFRSNAVLRWEYRPGSVLFLVWAQARDGVARAHGDFAFGQDLQDLFAEPAENVFMLKMSYWINP